MMAAIPMSRLEQAIRDFEAGRLAEAEAGCRAALAADPDHVDALNLLGTLTGSRGRYAEAADCFRRALTMAPPTANMLANLAEALRLQGRIDEALPRMRDAIAVARPAVAAMLGLKFATQLHGLGRGDDALALCREALRSAPEDAALNGLAAELLIGRKALTEAATHLLAAIRGAPDDDRQWERLNRLLRIGTLPPAQGRQWLLRALAHPVIRPLEIAQSVARTLCKEDRIATLARQAGHGELPSGAGAYARILADSAPSIRAGVDRLWSTARTLLLGHGAPPPRK